MKKLLMNIIAIITLTAALNINVNAQSNNDTISQHVNYQSMATQYLKKSHDQKVTAIVLAIGGSIMLVTGVGLAAASFKGFLDPNAQHNDYGSAPDILMIGGGALIVAAVPFSLASRANKKKARLYMNRENVMITPEIKTATQLVSIGIKISVW
jgi:hypothetical protein